MPEYIYPNSVQLTEIAQELAPRLAANRLIFSVLPITEEDNHIIEWEQRGNTLGLQQVRGLNGSPWRVKPLGANRYMYTPGVYGEFSLIDEQQLTTRRPFGALENVRIDISDLVRERQDQLLNRRLDRIEQIGWTLLSTGTFSVAQGSSVLHTDTFTLQTYAAGVAWATVATATPLADLRAVQLKSRGASVSFGAGAMAIMNRSTWNAMISNTNAADLGGKKGAGLASITGPAQVNQILSTEDLPNVTIYDEGYYDDSGSFQLFVPNNKVIVVGQRRDNDKIGEYRITRNANNPNLGPGPYMKVVDDPDRVPRTIEVHDGHNGGPVLYHPAAIVLMTV